MTALFLFLYYSVFYVINNIAAQAPCPLVRNHFHPRIFIGGTKEGRDEENRIVGGTDAKKGQFPWMSFVSVTNRKEGVSYCGGVLISSRHVLTAAHCVEPSTIVAVHYVILGLHKKGTEEDRNSKSNSKFFNKYGIARFDVHPDRDPGNNYNDIAVLTLKEIVTFTDTVQPICMGNITNLVRTNEELLVTGWGLTSPRSGGSDILQYVWLPVISGEDCKRRILGEIDKDVERFGEKYDENTICTWTKNKDSCGGDSGGPVIKKDGDKLVLVGLTSWGPEQCGNSQEPAVNTDVRKHRAWIDTIIGKHEEVRDLVSSPPKSRYFKAKHFDFQGFPGEARHSSRNINAADLEGH